MRGSPQILASRTGMTPMVHRPSAIGVNDLLNIGHHNGRRAQYIRRASILAATRGLLKEQGCENITTRKIADASGVSVQTVYNLVGSRDEVILRAIDEYIDAVSRFSGPMDSESNFISLIDSWCRQLMKEPEFCRRCNIIYFSENREIYHRKQDLVKARMTNFVKLQCRKGLFQEGIDCEFVADQLTSFMCFLFLEWSDKQFPAKVLRARLTSGLACIAFAYCTPAYASEISAWQRSGA